MGTSSRKSLAPGKAPKDNVHRNARCCLTPRERGCQVWSLSVHPPCRGGPSAPCATHAGHVLLQGRRFTSIPSSPGEQQRGMSCLFGKPLLRGLGNCAAFLLLGQQPRLCLKGLGLWFCLSFNSSFLLFFSQTGIWIRMSPSPTANRHRK